MDDEQFDEATCLEKVRRRDEDAARQLVEHFYPVVVRIVRGRLPRRASEEDLAQDIFLKMFTRLDQFHGPMPFAHWLSRIAVTTCLDALRAQGRRPELRLADLSEEEAAAAQGALSDQREAPRFGSGAGELIEKLLGQLSAEDQTVLRLLDLQERSVSEVSALTGLSQASVKVRAFRARRKMRRNLERLQPSLDFV